MEQRPRKYDLFGVQVSATTYDEVVDFVAAAAKKRQSAVASFHSAHAIVTSSDDTELRQRVNTFDIVAPDGQPVRWALNLLHKTELSDRVYGPEAMLRVCERAALDGIGIYLYGGRPDTLPRLETYLLERYPGLSVVGSHAPPFRPLTAEEDAACIAEINESGAGIVFIGLGCPKQDHFAFEHREHVHAVQLCVGAAFDFHAGVQPMAPPWMQQNGLEWAFRLTQEPKRLWRRYLATNSRFLYKLGRAITQRDSSTASTC